MGIDIRIPIGAMFTLLGVLVGAFGLLADPAIYMRSLGINVNLWWGAMSTVFGLAMLLAGRRSTR